MEVYNDNLKGREEEKRRRGQLVEGRGRWFWGRGMLRCASPTQIQYRFCCKVSPNSHSLSARQTIFAWQLQ